MSDSPEERAMATVKEAEALVKNVQRQLADGEAFLEQHGIKREKMREYVNRSMSPEDRRKAEEQIRKDLAEVDEEVHQAKLRNSSSQPSSSAGKPKRPRNMI